MDISTLVVVIVGFVALWLVFGYRQRALKELQESRRSSRLAELADEMEPSHTGRFRVQDMLKRTEPISRASEPSADEDEEPLPDPFASSRFRSSTVGEDAATDDELDK